MLEISIQEIEAPPTALCCVVALGSRRTRSRDGVANHLSCASAVRAPRDTVSAARMFVSVPGATTWAQEGRGVRCAKSCVMRKAH